MDTSLLLIFLMTLPLIAALIMFALPCKAMPAAVFGVLNVFFSACVCVLGLGLSASVVASGRVVMACGLWFGLDALACVFVFLICVVGLAASCVSVPYIRHDIEAGRLDASRGKVYYVAFQLFIGSMLLAVLSNNIVMMWAGIELTTVVGAVLVGIYREERFSLEAAWKYLVVCIAGVSFGFCGLLVLYANAAAVMPDASGAAFWTEIARYAPEFDPLLMQAVFVFAVIGFGTKAGLFPLHTWLPDAHSEAPAPVSALLSGVLLKCAVLAIIRFYSVVTIAAGDGFPSAVLLLFGAVTVCFAAVSVYVQRNLKRKLAYSSCENVGVIVFCLGIGGSVGVAAALMHCIFHGLTKALMFCLSGNVIMRYGTRDLGKIRGVGGVMPGTGVLLGIGLLALAGMPPFAMFLSEIVAFIAGVHAGLAWLVVIVGLALTVVVAAFVRVLVGSVLGKAPEGMDRRDVSPWALVPEIVLAAVVLWFGVAMPVTMLRGVEDAAAVVVRQNVEELHQTVFVKDLFANVQLDSTYEIRE